ncbi:Rab11 family-interacting protein 4 like protein [Argiope bruennichi]|uniref:Rab11 family-interacting protein 4 like protein n=1 Tax=Argiope bruennichi TaxID=94029 RepID=A0A8T0FYX5_ARGBR|nr:Rab11 family-interacting protein 4 like protein [Argiope bruennichi]
MASADEEFIKQLREVFDLCDELKCGIISVNQLRDIVRKHFGGSEEEVVQLIECLDPNQHGVVTFADFCRGVQSTLQIKGVNFEEAALRSQQPSVTLSGPNRRDDECSPPPPGDTDSAIATGSDVSRESLADKHDSGSDEAEENYTCLGHLSRPDNSSGSFRSASSHGSSHPSRRRRSSRMLNRSGSKRLSSSALASQLHRNGSRRNSQSSDEYPMDVPMSIEDDVLDLNQKVQELQQQVATLTDNQMNTDERYIKVKQENAALQNKCVLQILQCCGFQVQIELCKEIMRRGAFGNMFQILLAYCCSFPTPRNVVSSLSRKETCHMGSLPALNALLVPTLGYSRAQVPRILSPLRQSVFTFLETSLGDFRDDGVETLTRRYVAAALSIDRPHGIHSLEEQLRELEIRSEERIETEQQKFKEIMTRCERESKQEVEQYATKLFALQKEYMEMSEESLKLKTLVEKLKQEKHELQQQLLECTTELLNLREDHMRLQEAVRREREEFQIERTNNNKLLEELTKELEKHSEMQPDTRLRSPSLLELPAQYRELQQELRKVKDENKLILETNEELNAQLLANSLQEGRTLVNQNSAVSLADEFETLTKDEMMKALHDQKEVNEKLKAYIDGILLNILENHPQLLEVKNPM